MSNYLDRFKKLFASRRFAEDKDLVFKGNPKFHEHDKWGFRNPKVPDQAALVCIGDSTTYGNSVGRLNAWPHIIAKVKKPTNSVYSLACGGWGLAHYVRAAELYLPKLSPSAVVYGIFVGNDIMELGLHIERLLPEYVDDNIKKLLNDKTQIVGDSEIKPIHVGDWIYHTVAKRNEAHPFTVAGMFALRRALIRMRDAVLKVGATPFVMIIPTREATLAYGGYADDHYKKAVDLEGKYTEKILDLCSRIGIATTNPIDDLARNLEKGVWKHENWDGHTTEFGHKILAMRAAKLVSPVFDQKPTQDELDVYPAW